MRCEEVQARLPEYAGEGEPYPHEMEVHLATCRECAVEDGRYRDVVAAVRELRGVWEELPEGFTEHVMMSLARPGVIWGGRVRRLASDPRTRYAAASLGGAVVGAAAIALLLRRGVRRAVMPAA